MIVGSMVFSAQKRQYIQHIYSYHILLTLLTRGQGPASRAPGLGDSGFRRKGVRKELPFRDVPEPLNTGLPGARSETMIRSFCCLNTKPETPNPKP